LRRHIGPNLHTLTAADIMSDSPIYIDEDMLAADALNILTSKHITALFVCKGKCPIGIVHIHDVLKLGVA
jgi:arabinose-5-phosphate isomerase